MTSRFLGGRSATEPCRPGGDFLKEEGCLPAMVSSGAALTAEEPCPGRPSVLPGGWRPVGCALPQPYSGGSCCRVPWHCLGGHEEAQIPPQEDPVLLWGLPIALTALVAWNQALSFCGDLCGLNRAETW